MRAPNQIAQGSAHPSNANTSPRMSCSTRLELPGHGVDRAGIALWLEHESVETTGDVISTRTGASNSRRSHARRQQT